MKICKNAGICGGCFYQGISYEEELKEKEKGVRELLEPVIENPLEQQANAYISDASDGHLAEPIIPSQMAIVIRWSSPSVIAKRMVR